MVQKGKIATLINEVRVSGKDQWTNLFAFFKRPSNRYTTLPDNPMVKKWNNSLKI